MYDFVILIIFVSAGAVFYYGVYWKLCVVFRLCRGGFGCSHGGGGGGGGGCALCSLVLVCSSVTNTNIILHYSSFLVKKTL